MELAIKSIILSFVCVCGFFLVDAYKKEKKNFLVYLRNFGLGIIIFYVLGLIMLPKAEAAEWTAEQIELEIQNRSQLKIQIEKDQLLNYLTIYRRLNDDQRRYYEKEMKINMKEAKKSYRRAEELAAWHLPTHEEREKADYCWAAAGIVIFAKAAGAGPMSILLDVILTTSGQYLYKCSEQWQEMRFHLQKAKYHYEMAEWYADVLSTNGGDTYPSRRGRRDQDHPIIIR